MLGRARFDVASAERSGKRVAEAHAVSFAYPGEPALISDLDVLVERGDRIGLIGPNGSGKTTLLRLLLGALEPTSGEIVLGTRVEVAYFSIDRKPTTHASDGTHKATGRYDERGNRIEWAFFDTKGQPSLNQDGIHKVTGRYDKRGNQIEWAFFDTTGQPSRH